MQKRKRREQSKVKQERERERDCEKVSVSESGRLTCKKHISSSLFLTMPGTMYTLYRAGCVFRSGLGAH